MANFVAAGPIGKTFSKTHNYLSMSDNDDLRKDDFPSGLQLYPEVDLEDAIMASVHQEAELRKKVRRLRRRGMAFLSLFLLLLGFALYCTQAGYSTDVYASPLLGYGFSLLFLLVFFVQLEVWWRSRIEEA